MARMSYPKKRHRWGAEHSANGRVVQVEHEVDKMIESGVRAKISEMSSGVVVSMWNGSKWSRE